MILHRNAFISVDRVRQVANCCPVVLLGQTISERSTAELSNFRGTSDLELPCPSSENPALAAQAPQSQNLPGPHPRLNSPKYLQIGPIYQPLPAAPLHRAARTHQRPLALLEQSKLTHNCGPRPWRTSRPVEQQRDALG